MRSLFSFSIEAFDSTAYRRSLRWIYGLSLLLSLWFGASLLLDVIIMPTLSKAGMMTSADFISAGFNIFHQFNSVELVVGALMLSGGLVLIRQGQILHQGRFSLYCALLFTIPLVYFYYLVPEMAGLGLAVDLASEGQPTAMNAMHLLYWGLDLLKIACVVLYLSELWQSFQRSQPVSLL
ncbi:hypothetical protein [Lyngbya confervoides]|uniref:DUF4149 domain-containing protein n=1 Tax=Lyngbya confervoides BDU141951 TaxID=1574623 RepID=A0ABD4SXR7_9CYAN|nr:hypothetical protein [Lyngbya confervoides]MCM1981273.1 hypothetical protein [Lyngbya confervoides BDU141951]